MKFQLGRQIQRVLLQKGEACLGTPLRCLSRLRGPLIWPEASSPGCTPSLGMSLCGLGLLGDNLGKILGRARGSALWRSSHPQKPDFAPGRPVTRPGSSQRLGRPSPRSVGGAMGAGVKEEPSSPWVAGPQMGVDGGWRVWGVSSRRPRPKTPELALA